MSDPTRLDGRTILVTGAAGGIGTAVARSCAARGARLFLTDLPSDRLDDLAQELGAPSASADLANADQAQRAIAEVMEYGTPDGLVTAAGMNTRTPMLELPLSEWDQVQSVNLRGTFIAIQAVARAMLGSSHPGSIVAVGSIGAWQPYPGLGHYEVAKAGVHALVRAWAVALPMPESALMPLLPASSTPP